MQQPGYGGGVAAGAGVSSNSGPNNQIDQVLTILIKRSVLQMMSDFLAVHF